jgi:M6 family metalloprotease-like protein
VKILILPINLADVPFTDSDLTKVKSAVEKTSEIYKTISYGKLKMEFTIPEKSEWVTLNKTADSYGIVENKPQQNNEIVVIDAIAASSSKINFDLYDGVIVETGFFKSSGGGQGFPGQKYPTAHGTAKGVSFEFGTGVGQWQTIAHEFGHSLFFLEDLYVFLNPNRPSVPDPLPAGRWDMMSSSEPTFFGWSRLLMGYLEDSELRCVSDQKESTHYLTNIDSKTGNKLVLLNIKEGRTLAMEARTAYDSNQGLLVYEIDSSINHGDGPIKAQKKLLYEGDLLTVLGYAITVKASDKKGLLFGLTKLI